MRHLVKSDILNVTTKGGHYLDITGKVTQWLHRYDVTDGLLTLLIRHTSASLAIQENADPDVMRDLRDALTQLAPESPHYRHHMEGPDDMPAHIKSVITPVNLSIPVSDGHLMLDTWQGIFVLEHRSRSHQRQIALHLSGLANE